MVAYIPKKLSKVWFRKVGSIIIKMFRCQLRCPSLLRNYIIKWSHNFIHYLDINTSWKVCEPWIFLYEWGFVFIGLTIDVTVLFDYLHSSFVPLVCLPVSWNGSLLYQTWLYISSLHYHLDVEFTDWYLIGMKGLFCQICLKNAVRIIL